MFIFSVITLTSLKALLFLHAAFTLFSIRTREIIYQTISSHSSIGDSCQSKSSRFVVSVSLIISLLVSRDIQEIVSKLLNRLMFLTPTVMLMLAKNELKLRVQAHSVLVF